jgi:[acyl-carrier-protein] S-malonyltransferase
LVPVGLIASCTEARKIKKDEIIMSYAWLFPGQGAQVVGMGKQLFDSSPAARLVFEQADDALGFSISKLCFEGPDEALLLTKNTQPAIVTTSVAALMALKEKYPELPKPSFVAGHSLGEYSALVAAGALRLSDAVKLVHIRGQAMQEAVPAGVGAMAAIMGGDVEAVERLCRDAAQGDALSPANFNAPGQIVIAGTKGAIERAANHAKERSLKAIVLKVSAPFHCSLMKPAADKVREALAEIQISRPEIPVVANVDALAHQEAGDIAELLIRQVDSAVRWDKSVQLMTQQGVNQALELGPGKVLAGLARRIDKSLKVKSIGTPEAILETAEFLKLEI